MHKLVKRGNTTAMLPDHNYPTRTCEDLRVPQHNLTIFQHSLAFSGPKIWNSVPQQIKTLPSLSAFKRHLKKYILTQY